MGQMAARTTRSKTRVPYAPQPKAPPVAEKPAPAKPAPPLSSIKVRDDEGDELNAALAQYGMRVPALGEFGEGGFRLNEGVIPRRWARESASVMALARQLAARKEEYERSIVGRAERFEKMRAERAKLKSKMYAGMVSLTALLAQLGDKAPSVGRSKKAVEAAHLIHRKFHFGPKDVEAAMKVLRGLPTVSPRAEVPRGAAPGAVRRGAALPAGRIVVHVRENPHRASTTQAERMATLMSHAGKLVEDYLTAGGCKLKLGHALAEGWVTVGESQDAPAKVPAKVAPATETAPLPARAKAPAKAEAPAPAKAPRRARASARAKHQSRRRTG